MKFSLPARGAALAGLAVAALLTWSAAPARAQAVGEKPLKVALIDVQRLVTESARGKVALAKLKSLQEQKVAEGKAKQDEIDGLRKKINEGRLSLADDKIAEMEKQLEDRMIAFRRFQDDAQRDLQKTQEQALGDVERLVMPIIEKVGKEFGYTMIFNKFQSGLVYADDSIDITPLIVQRFDASKDK